MNRSLPLALSVVALAASLSACAPLVIGGAAVGAAAMFDRRTSGTQLDDEGIELRASSRLRDTMGERAHVSITSFNRQVLLTGEVPSEQAKAQAGQIVARVENVRGIVNELAVLPATTLAQRSSDTLVTGKVKASLLDDKTLSVAAFKVVTERGVVYVMGRVTQREADRATQIARTIGGVQRVVRIFEYISEDDLRQINAGNPIAPQPRTAPAPVAPAAVTPVTPVAPPPAPMPVPPVATPGGPSTPSTIAPTPLPPAR